MPTLAPTPLRQHLDKRLPLLTKEQQRDLIVAAQAGDHAARRTTIERNVGLIYTIAKRRCHTTESHSIEDLVAFGVIGMNRAIDKFDISLDLRFSTYATHWINQAMSRAAEEDHLIRIPVHVVSPLTTAQRRLAERSGDLPTDEQIHDFIEARRTSDNTKTPSLRCLRQARAALRLRSFDAPLGHDTDLTYHGTISDPHAHDTGDFAAGRIDGERLRELINQLPAQEAAVLTHRYGLAGAPQLTLAELGEQLGIDPVRCRTIEMRVLRQLRRALEAA